MMAAEVLASAGVRVTIYELHRSLGRKLLLAGRSGLNLTHSEPLDRFLGHYDPRPTALENALREFDPTRLRAWAEELGEATFVGSSGRVFPESFRAAPLLRAWLRRLASLGVEFRPGHRWTGWTTDGHLRFAVGGEEVTVTADAVVIACGGASWPRVGSDGGWAVAFAERDIEVRPLQASNAGLLVTWTDVFRDRFEGEPVKNVVVEAGGTRSRGEFVITRAGLEGGPIYAASAAIRRELSTQDGAQLLVDLVPDLSIDRLHERLGKRRPKDSQSTWLRRAGIAPVAIGLLREATANRLPDDPAQMATLLRAVPMEVVGLMPIDRAISTAGGVTFEMIDDGFMLRDVPGTFVAGEMLDWDAPTGGYLLQACFATGAAAGQGAVRWLGG